MFKTLFSAVKLSTVFLLFLIQPAFGFNQLSTETFDAIGYIAASNNNISGTEKSDLSAETQSTMAAEEEELKVDRSLRTVSFSFAPTKSFGFTIDHYKAALNFEDHQYQMPAGPKNTHKEGYERTAIGLRTMFINNSSSVKVGLLNELIMNNTADQDGEAFALTPFFYLGHHLPFSIRYAYNVEASRRKTREVEADVSTIDKFYGSHFYIRFEPYYSVARLPFGYEYYQRNGTAPDLVSFDTKKDRTIEHRLFINLPAKMQLTLSVQSRDDVDSVGLGLEIPFF